MKCSSSKHNHESLGPFVCHMRGDPRWKDQSVKMLEREGALFILEKSKGTRMEKGSVEGSRGAGDPVKGEQTQNCMNSKT